ncbi:hypothetical protein HDU67_007078 [Dinochytrium kinnereticum]|nr:hypothetical protein HDU67_007078 [Dinochytrium kinnereticum]
MLSTSTPNLAQTQTPLASSNGKAQGDAKPNAPSTFTVTHQKVLLQVDFKSKTIHGVAELLLNTTSSFPSEIRLNANQIAIREVTVNEENVSYSCNDPWNLDFEENKNDPQNHPEFRKKYLSALDSSDAGELAIDVAKILATAAGSAVIETANSSAIDSMLVRISYTVQNPKTGIHFDYCDSNTSFAGFPQFYTDNQARSARFWMPCVDKQQERCTWEIEIIVPRAVKDILPDGSLIAGLNYLSEDFPEMMALTSGELVSHYIHPKSSRLKVFKYTMEVPVPAGSVFVTVAPFVVTEILDKDGKLSQKQALSEVPDKDKMDLDNDELMALDQPGKLLAFSLPSCANDIRHCVGFLSQVN